MSFDPSSTLKLNLPKMYIKEQKAVDLSDNPIHLTGFDLSGCPGGIHALKCVRPTQD